MKKIGFVLHISFYICLFPFYGLYEMNAVPPIMPGDVSVSSSPVKEKKMVPAVTGKKAEKTDNYCLSIKLFNNYQ